MRIPINVTGGKRRQWNSIPRIDWGNPLAYGLVCYCYDTGTGLVVDLVTGHVPAIVFSPKKNTPSLFGNGLNYAGSGTGGITFPVNSLLDGIFTAKRYSIASAWNLTALPAVSPTCIFGVNDSVGNNCAAILLDAATGADIQIIFANITIATFTANSVNTFHTLVASNTGAASQSVYFDGTLNTTNTQNPTFTTTTAGAMFNTASTGGNGNDGTVGWVYYGAVWNRPISAREAAALHYDPYSFLIYPEDEINGMLVGSSAAPTVFEDSWHQSMSAVGRQIKIIRTG